MEELDLTGELNEIIVNDGTEGATEQPEMLAHPSLGNPQRAALEASDAWLPSAVEERKRVDGADVRESSTSTSHLLFLCSFHTRSRGHTHGIPQHAAVTASLPPLVTRRAPRHHRSSRARCIISCPGLRMLMLQLTRPCDCRRRHLDKLAHEEHCTPARQRLPLQQG